MSIFKILSRFDGRVLFELECGSVKLCVEAAVKSGASLDGANLTRANLDGANLYGASLDGANLTRANLDGANLDGANLTRASLDGANLYGASLTRASLDGANLYGANLTRANLDGANLYGASLTRANLDGANLYGANLTRANLDGASLDGASLDGANLDGANLTRASLDGANLYGASLENARGLRFQIPEGDLIGWKKVAGGRIAKLLIPADAKRTATPIGRKCRAEFAKTLEIQNEAGKTLKVSSAASNYDMHVVYTVGEITRPNSYNDDFRLECTNGLHFFATRQEAVEY
jgi:hypothetical protein